MGEPDVDVAGHPFSACALLPRRVEKLRTRRPGIDVPVALGRAAAFVASASATLHAAAVPSTYDSVTMFVALLLVARYVELARAGERR